MSEYSGLVQTGDPPQNFSSNIFRYGTKDLTMAIRAANMYYCKDLYKFFIIAGDYCKREANMNNDYCKELRDDHVRCLVESIHIPPSAIVGGKKTAQTQRVDDESYEGAYDELNFNYFEYHSGAQTILIQEALRKQSKKDYKCEDAKQAFHICAKTYNNSPYLTQQCILPLYKYYTCAKMQLCSPEIKICQKQLEDTVGYKDPTDLMMCLTLPDITTNVEFVPIFQDLKDCYEMASPLQL
mmetsp:Transcript_14133/g.21381  ORF Transcript_14133/g.21381 Transcript_14133/m.21381 type:complete len:240 (+) Transcript_14133:63-782(+)